MPQGPDPLAHLDSMPKDGANVPVTVDTVKNGQLQRKKIVPEFNVGMFVKAVDSIMPGRTNRPRYRFHIMEKFAYENISFWQPLNIAGTAKKQMYQILNRNLMEFWVLKLKYPNENMAKQAMNSLRILYENKTSGFISKANDYVIQTGDQIMWLNTPCSYSAKTHNAVKKSFLQSLKIPPVTDSIQCQCGQKCY